VKTSTIRKTLAVLAAATFAAPMAFAEDIDIYGGIGGQAGPKPNILILVDNASRNNSDFPTTCAANSALSGSKLFDMVQCALFTAVTQVSAQTALNGKFNLGLMVYGPGSNKGGEWIVPTPPPVSTGLLLMDTAGVTTFNNLMVNPGLGTSNNAAASASFQEAWAFFTGNTGLSGTTYSSHLGSSGITCQKSFIIFIGAASKNGEPETGNGDAGGAGGLASAGATSAQQVQINSSYIGAHTADDGHWPDEWARFLYQTDFGNNINDKQNITTYTIAATGGTQDDDYVQLLQSTANSGGGKAFIGSDVNSMTQALLAIFNEVQAVNSVFASSSLPVSANSQGTYLNQVFIGMFRPDKDAGPRWLGNLKQYQFGVGGTAANPTLFLADANGASAISAAATGFISPNAVSFWTDKDTGALPDSIGGFYLNNPNSVGGAFDSPDGELVEKGGAAQQLRLANLQSNYATDTTTPRHLYTCLGTSCIGGASLNGMHIATNNSDLTDLALGLTGNSSSVSSISRNGTTVTMVLSAAPSPALTNGQAVTVSGSSNVELNGTFTISLVNATTFTYTIVESPPSPSTGTYTASIPSTPKAVTTLTRSGTTVTATVPSHGWTTGTNVTMGGANEPEYNGTYAITHTGTNTFTYTMIDSPRTASTGGTATAGANSITFTVSQISRTTTVAAGTSTVTILLSTDLPSTFVTGTNVTVSGVTPTGWNVTNVPIMFGGGNSNGDNCPGINGGNKKKAFCYSITTTPASPATGTITADATLFVNVTGFTHTASCSGGTPTPNVTVTATTSSNHPFATGNTVTIGGIAGTRESAYLGAKAITKISNTSFSFTKALTTTPPCSPSTTGVQVITSAGSINKDTLVRWIRGEDNFGDELGPQNGVTVRPSIHGDVLHSRPAVINYGSPTGVVVFYGSNDGVYRAVNGNQPLNTGGPNIGSGANLTPPGGEIFGFIPSEFLTKLSRQYTNSPKILLATTPTGIIPTPAKRDYFFDGATGVYQNGSTVSLFVSARRGGRFIYALNVNDPTDPKFLWKKSNSDISELGYTWSTPKAARVRGYANPVVIFGGGHDPGDDNEPPSTHTMGRGIYILDATNGNVVWKAEFSGGGGTSCTGNPCNLAGMTYAIASDVTLVNRDFDTSGYIDRIYATDLGGNIWRVDLEPAGYAAAVGSIGPSTWQVTKFAALGGTGATPRKFFYPPDIVATKNFDMIMAVTGDREHPLYSASGTTAYSIVNRFYALKDVKTGADATGATTITDATSATANNSVTGMTDATSATYNPATNDNGFYITLTNAGEKGVNAPITIGGYTYFGTNTPPTANASACTNLGIARGYQVNFLTGAKGNVIFDGGGLPPSPVAGLVNVNVDGSPRSVPFCLGCGNPGPSATGPDATSPLGGGKPPIPVPPIRKRVYWYIEKHDT
jgi:type IV pilus assembly protein PilY1